MPIIKEECINIILLIVNAATRHVTRIVNEMHKNQVINGTVANLSINSKVQFLLPMQKKGAKTATNLEEQRRQQMMMRQHMC